MKPKTNTPPPPIQTIQNTRLNTNSRYHARQVRCCCAPPYASPILKGGLCTEPHTPPAPAGHLAVTLTMIDANRRIVGGKWCVYMCSVWCMSEKSKEGKSSQQGSMPCVPYLTRGGEEGKTRKRMNREERGVFHIALSIAVSPPQTCLDLCAAVPRDSIPIFCPSKNKDIAVRPSWYCPSPKPKRPSRKITNVVV